MARRARPGIAWSLPALLVTVLALKLVLALTLAGHPLLQPVGELDPGEYWRLSGRVADGDLLLAGTPFYVSPLYIYWLAFARLVTGDSVAGILALQALVGTFAVWGVWRVTAAWALTPRETDLPLGPLAAAGAFALTGIVALQEALILQSALDPLLMTWLALAFTRAVQAPTSWRWLLCGASLALLSSNRPNAWLLAVLCLPAAWMRPGAVGVAGRLRAAAAAMLGVSLVLAPLTARTVVATGAWQLLPGHGGLNLYIGNHQQATGTYTVVDGIRPSIEGQRDDVRRVAGTALGREVTDDEASSYFVGQARAWWQSRPRDATALALYKLWLTTHAWELPVNVSHAWFREQVWLLRLLPVGAWLLVPIGIGVTIAGHCTVPIDHRPAWRWFRWLLPAYLASVAAFFVVDRYRAPALVIGTIHLGLLAAWMQARVASRAGRSAAGAGQIDSRRTRVAGGAAVGVGLASFLAGLIPLPFDPGLGEHDTRMALHAIEQGRDADATAWLSRAAGRHPTPGVAWFRAGLAWQSRNDLVSAERALREAHRLDPGVAAVAYALGEVLISEGKGSEAVPLLEQADRAGERPDRVRLDLALAHWQAGDTARARAVLAQGVPAEGLPLLRARALAALETRRFDLAEWLLAEYGGIVRGDAEVIEKLGLVKARSGDTAAAASLLEEAVRLDDDRATARFNLAIVRLQQGRRDQAIALLREALRIDPTYAQAAGALREILGQR